MELHQNLIVWNEARALVGLAAYENAEKVSEAVRLALAYETLHSHPHPDVSYSEQIAVFKRKVDRLLDENKRIIESRRYYADEKRDSCPDHKEIDEKYSTDWRDR